MITQTEIKIIDFIKKYYLFLVLALGLFGGLYARSKGMAVSSGDWENHIQHWMNTLHENGGFSGLALEFSDYYIPYLILLALGTYLDPSLWLSYVKLISILFEIGFSIAATLIVRKVLCEKCRNHKWEAAVFAILMMSPMIVLNGAFWAQCDYIYGMFIMLSVYFLLCEKYTLTFNMLGLAFVFKLQTVFVIPVFILIWLCNKRFSILHFLWIPFWYIIAGFPAIIAGRSASSVYNIYLNQTNTYNNLTMNIPNIYSFFPNEYTLFSSWGIVVTVTILSVLAFWVILGDYYLDNKAILGLCLCTTGICGMFLPAMHERYISLYVGVAYVYYLAYSKKKVVIAGVLDLIACITYFQFLFGRDYSSINCFAVLANYIILFYNINDVIAHIKSNCKSIKCLNT